MGNVSIDISLSNIWRSWHRFRSGKRRTRELDHFQYYLERNLFELWHDVNSGAYAHQSYTTFITTDTKRRTVSVASIRDRVVHRLLYDYLYPIYDSTFSYDAWSCRTGKGLLGAIKRARRLVGTNHHGYVWRGDIKKFFESVNQALLSVFLVRRISDPVAQRLLNTVIASYSTSAHERERESKSARRGMPIGNLTSQIFANIYLNELDRYVTHAIQPKSYVRYGDDWIINTPDFSTAQVWRESVLHFLDQHLLLTINSKNDIVVQATRGIHFLGVEIFPGGRRLKKRAASRAVQRINHANIPSYYGLIRQHQTASRQKMYDWQILSYMEQNEV